MLLQGMYTHPDVVINTRRPLLPRVPHQGGCTAVGASQIMGHGLCQLCEVFAGPFAN